MRDLHEDPAEFEQLHQSLRSEIAPRGSYEEILVEEMAVNRWRLARLRRAEMGALITQRSVCELHVRQPELSADEGLDGLMIHYRGLAGTTDTTRKYMQMLELLHSLEEQVENEGFTAGGVKILAALYGQSPTPGGANLVLRFEQGLAASQSPEVEEENKPADHAVTDGTKKKELEGARGPFLGALSREIESCAANCAAQLQLRTVPIPEAAYDQALMLPQEKSERIMRYDAMLQKGFERLQNQLLAWRSRQRESPRG